MTRIAGPQARSKPASPHPGCPGIPVIRISKMCPLPPRSGTACRRSGRFPADSGPIPLESAAHGRVRPPPHFPRIRAESLSHLHTCCVAKLPFTGAISGVAGSSPAIGEIVSTLQNPKRFTSVGRLTATMEIPQAVREKVQPLVRHYSQGLINVDPPDHTRMRKLVHKAFLPGTIAAMAGYVEEIVEGLIDEVRPRGGMDIIWDLSYPLPVTVIARLLGVPAADHGKLKRWSGENYRVHGYPQARPRRAFVIPGGSAGSAGLLSIDLQASPIGSPGRSHQRPGGCRRRKGND